MSRCSIQNQNIDVKNESEQLLIDLICENPSIVKKMADGQFTEKICEAIVMHLDVVNLFKYIPERFYSNHLFLNAVLNNIWALEIVPDNFKTESMCLSAITRHGRALKYVPERFQSEELCELVIKNYPFAIDDVIFKSEKLISLAIKTKGSSYERVPTHLQTEELNLLAVTEHPENLGIIENPSKKVWETAIRLFPCSVFSMDRPKREMIKFAIEQDVQVLSLLAEQDENICLFALKRSPEAYKNVRICNNPDHHATFENLLKMKEVKKNKSSLKNKLGKL